MEAAPDPIVNYDMAGRVIYINPAFTRVFGWTLEECAGQKMDHFVPEACWPETRIMIRQVISGDGIFDVETRRYAKDGRLVEVSISGASAFDSRGGLAGSIIILRDITRSRRLEKQVMQAGDRERMNIGHELHDDLCPHLIGIAGLAEVLRDDLDQRRDASAQLAQKIGELMADAVDKTRQLARGLCPVHLVAHGFQNALEEIRERFAFHPGIRLTCQMDPDVDIPDNTLATHLYYIAREAVNNAVKHSKGKDISISLTREPGPCGLVHLKVTDDGRGIPESGRGAGIGLQIMAYRAKIIDAQLFIHSGQTGTQVHACLPVDEKEGPGDDRSV